MDIEGAFSLRYLPEAIKLAPVSRRLWRHPDRVVCKVCVTAQHCRGEQRGRGAGEQRDFIYIADLCRAILLALESDGAARYSRLRRG